MCTLGFVYIHKYPALVNVSVTLLKAVLTLRYCVSSGFETESLTTAVWPGGEIEALLRLERHLERKVWRSYYTVYAQKKKH